MVGFPRHIISCTKIYGYEDSCIMSGYEDFFQLLTSRSNRNKQSARSRTTYFDRLRSKNIYAQQVYAAMYKLRDFITLIEYLKSPTDHFWTTLHNLLEATLSDWFSVQIGISTQITLKSVFTRSHPMFWESGFVSQWYP